MEKSMACTLPAFSANWWFQRSKYHFLSLFTSSIRVLLDALDSPVFPLFTTLILVSLWEVLEPPASPIDPSSSPTVILPLLFLFLWPLLFTLPLIVPAMDPCPEVRLVLLRKSLSGDLLV